MEKTIGIREFLRAPYRYMEEGKFIITKRKIPYWELTIRKVGKNEQVEVCDKTIS
jgi:hypothetical protein